MQSKISVIATAALFAACGNQNGSKAGPVSGSQANVPGTELPQKQTELANELPSPQSETTPPNASKPANEGASAGEVTSPSADADKDVQCFGINSCSPYAQCAVTAADIEATKKVFGEKYANSEVHACAGLGKCAAQEGQLNWMQVSQQECADAGGFLINTDSDGSRKVVVLK